jgi:serine phosphatase RsbU (regulator of sigma subunit)
MFKLAEWPSASIQLILGVFIYSLIVGPLVARMRYEKWHTHVKSKLRLLGIMLADSAGFAFVGLGLLFWIQKWPLAMILVFVGLLVLVASAIMWNTAIDLLFGIQLDTSQKLKVAFGELNENHQELQEKNKEIQDSIEYAKRIQNAILPPERIIKSSLPNSFILYKPKDVVAGDFYWLEHIEETVLFASADCTGHGVPGAMVSVVCVNSLNRAVREFGLKDPAKILDKTRSLVIKEFEKSEEEVKDGMDISLCALDYNSKTLKWAGANNPLWVIRKDSQEIEEIKADKQPIGKYASATPFTAHSLTLNQGDTIYLFSDGYPDQFGGDRGKKYKSGKFKKTLLSIVSQPIDLQKDLLDQEFETWRQDIEQIDDVCVIGVRL